jgi:hypothetical protein
VQRDDDRDRAIDRALRESLRARVTASRDTHAGEHIDGERLAAWTEGALRPDEAAIIERHLADCGQCQQLLVVFARTSPPPIASEPLWRRWRLQWLVPIATAATALAIWVAAPRPQPAPTALTALPAAAPTGERESAQNSTAAPPPPPATAPDQSRDKALSRVLSPTDSFARKETLERFEEPKERANASAKPDATRVPAAPQPQSAAATLSQNAAQTADATISLEANARARDEKPARGLAETVPTRPTPPPAAVAAGRGARSDVAAFTARQAVNAVEIASPNAAMRWLFEGRQVLHSTNAGTTWQTATLPTTNVLTAGMSPAPSICWIVGRAGTVLVTSDGLRFTRVAFPEPIDLVSVTATDDRHAIVTSADGRTFRTEDQGANWTR